MITLRTIPIYKTLRPRIGADIIGEYTDINGVIRNDWNDLVTNLRHVHGVGILAGQCSGINGGSITNNGATERTKIIAGAVDLMEGYRHATLAIRLQVGTFTDGGFLRSEILTVKLNNSGAEQVIKQIFRSGTSTTVSGGYPVASGTVDVYFKFKISPALWARGGTRQRAYVTFEREFGGFGGAFSSGESPGIRAWTMQNYLECQ